MKSKPQSRIHFRCSSVVVPLDDEGLGEKKSRRLKPFHLGSLFAGGNGQARAFPAEALIAAAANPEFLMNVLRFIRNRIL